MKATAHLQSATPTLTHATSFNRGTSPVHAAPKTYSSSSRVNHISARPVFRHKLLGASYAHTAPVTVAHAAPVSYSTSSHVAPVTRHFSAASVFQSPPAIVDHAAPISYTTSSHVAPVDVAQAAPFSYSTAPEINNVVPVTRHVAAASVFHPAPTGVDHAAPISYSTSSHVAPLAVDHAAPLFYSTASEINHVAPIARHFAAAPVTVALAAPVAAAHAAPITYSTPHQLINEIAPFARYVAASPDFTPVAAPLLANASPTVYVPTSAVNHAVPVAKVERHGLFSARHLNFVNGVAHNGLSEGHFSSIAYGGPKSIHH